MSKPATQSQRIGFGLVDWALAALYAGIAFMLSTTAIGWWAFMLIGPAILAFATNPMRSIHLYRLGYQRGLKDMFDVVTSERPSDLLVAPHPADQYEQRHRKAK